MNKIKGIAITFVVFGFLLFVTPSFLLPDFLYQSIYGWRYPKEWKCGESFIVDKGPGISYDRYTVHLGTVDLEQKGIFSWKLCMLPQEELFCGLFITVSEKWKVEHEKNLTKNTIVAMRLYSENSELIFEKIGKLGSDWSWSGFYGGNYTFVYGDTAITPKKQSKYRLEFEVISAEKKNGIAADIVLRGGGWK